MKKLLKSVLVSAAMLTVFAGCSSGGGSASSENGGQQKEEDGIKVYSGFFAVPGEEVPDSSRLYQAIAKESGAKVKVTWLTGQTAKERIGVMISGGDYPDLVDASDGRSAMVDAGAYIPLEDYILETDDYPNLRALYSDVDWEKIKSANDGHIYTIPQFSSTKVEDMDPNYGGEAFWIQKRVLEWADWPVLTTVEEYFDLIGAYLEANPETDGQKNIGFETLSDDWRYFALENPPQFLAGYPNDGAAIVDPDTLEAKVYDLIPEAEEYFQILSEQYDKGVIDPETFTLKYDQYIAKLSSGRVLGMIDQGWNFNTAVDSLNAQEKYDLTYIPWGLVLDSGVTPQYREVNTLNTNGGVGITTSAKDVEGILSFLDYLVSEEGTILNNWGELGVDYEIDDSGKFYRTEEQRATWKDPDYYKVNRTPYSYLPGFKGMLPDGINAVNPSQQPEEYLATLEDYDKEVLAAYGHEKWTDFVAAQDPLTPWFPIYTERNTWTAKDEAGIASQNMQEVKMQWLPKVISGGAENFTENWKAYTNDYEKRINYKAYEEALTTEVKRRVEADKEIRERLGAE